mmetsp:Transcript_48659/g.103813  ORF Transcript_48659/g.103813 Transcript_48659/m.103813 type:complete len:212 (+) Transcript_48659:116-751(+)
MLTQRRPAPPLLTGAAHSWTPCLLACASAGGLGGGLATRLPHMCWAPERVPSPRALGPPKPRACREGLAARMSPRPSPPRRVGLDLDLAGRGLARARRSHRSRSWAAWASPTRVGSAVGPGRVRSRARLARCEAALPLQAPYAAAPASGANVSGHVQNPAREGAQRVNRVSEILRVEHALQGARVARLSCRERKCKERGESRVEHGNRRIK